MEYSICIYMIFALMDYQGGIDGFIGMAIFQPIMGAILSVLTILVCFLLGLPIRLIRKVRVWWSRRFYIAIGLTFVGLILLGLSFMHHFMQVATILRDGIEITKSIPNGGLVISGWFLTAFCILHTFPPEGMKIKVQQLLTKVTGIK